MTKYIPLNLIFNRIYLLLSLKSSGLGLNYSFFKTISAHRCANQPTSQWFAISEIYSNTNTVTIRTKETQFAPLAFTLKTLQSMNKCLITNATLPVSQ